MFPLIAQDTIRRTPALFKGIATRAKTLCQRFECHLPCVNVEDCDWVHINTLSSDSSQKSPFKAQEELAELKTGGASKITFGETCLDEFWLAVGHGYPSPSDCAVESLLPFPPSCLCELAFSHLTHVKSKWRQRRLSAEEDRRVAPSSVSPRVTRPRSQKEGTSVPWSH
ncbi:hypothetical protein AAFF_G00222500 [Aldrovandia affinis]|uniref:Uncharacterized protein n=1 Tax=Aldrovandia affinis TaxID=143900 RepID=A0AAD7RFR1_9TELE|nr:hypothetical protein AAFF_G00222500 [Aldrovandia affinis]